LTGQPEHASQDRQECDRQNRKGRTQRKDIKGQAKQEPDFHFGFEEKARIRAFFLSRSALSLFSRFFSSRFRALFFASRSRARKREKSAGAHLCESGDQMGSFDAKKPP
jgi:hypothetical protein